MKEKRCTIFYSWQSDIKESRNFISDCLKKLEKDIRPMILCDIDRDTKGLAGSPDIGDSIYEKIDVADIFIADVTIINREFEGRKTPNPNVMIELGYAIKALGWDRIILIYNRDYGEVESLPFDINHRRMTSYSLNEGEKSETRKRLISSVKATIQILEQEHRLYGGTLETANAKMVLVQLLKSGLRRIWEAYYAKYVLDDTSLYDQLVSVSETQLGLIEDLQLLTYEKVLTRPVVDLINALSVELFYEYESKREYDGAIVFSSSEEKLCVYAIDGRMLCSGYKTELGFTGYKCTREYEGEFEV